MKNKPNYYKLFKKHGGIKVYSIPPQDIPPDKLTLNTKGITMDRFIDSFRTMRIPLQSVIVEEF